MYTDSDRLVQAREEIIAHDANNKTVLERIQSAIIVLALDQSKPVTREEIGNALWVGDGRNRFFDKHQSESCSCGITPSRGADILCSHRL